MLVLHLCLLILPVFHEVLVHAPVCWYLWLLLVSWFWSGIALAWSSTIFNAVVWASWYEIVSLSVWILVVLCFSRVAAIRSLMLLGIWSTLSIWICLDVSTRHVVCWTIKDHSCTLLVSTMAIICTTLRRWLLYLPPFDTIYYVLYVFGVNSASLLMMWPRIHTTVHVQLLWIIHLFNFMKNIYKSGKF